MQTFLLCMTFLVIGFIAGIICICRYIDWQHGRDKKSTERLNRYINMLNQWLILKEIGVGVYSTLNQSNIKCIAVYGMGIYGRHLVRELQNVNLENLYGIDRKKMSPYRGVSVFGLTEGLPPVDIIINTVITEHESICEVLKRYFECPIVNLEDVLFESYPIGQ